MKLQMLLTGLLLASAGAAAALDLPDAGRMLRESTPPPALRPVPEWPAQKLPAPPDKTRLPEGIRITVSGFTYSGNTIFTAAELDQIMAPAFGRELTLAELEAAADSITQAYRSRGYPLSSASIPPQTLKPGQPIHIEIIEGKLERIEIRTSPAETRTPRWLMVRYFNQIQPGKPVNSGDLTRALMLFNELPAIQGRTLFEPGHAAGSTRAILDVNEGKAYSFQVDSDNHGNYSTGYYRTGAGVELYSPFRLGDQLNLSFQSSTSGDTRSLRSGWRLPASGYGTRVSIDYSYVSYELGRAFKELDGHGDAHDLVLSVFQPLIRRPDLYLNGTLTAEGRILDDRVELASSRNRRHSVNGQAGLSAVYLDSLAGTTTLSVTWTIGALRFDDAEARENDQSSSGLHTQGIYNKVSGAFSRSQTVWDNLSLYGSLNGQWSSCNLGSAEQLSLGGPYAVRAYPVSEASSDRGLVATAELRYLQQLGSAGSLQLSGLFDYGYGQINAQPISGTTGTIRRIYGSGFGIGYFFNDTVSLKTSVAWRMGELPAADNTQGHKPTVYVQATVRY